MAERMMRASEAITGRAQVTVGRNMRCMCCQGSSPNGGTEPSVCQFGNQIAQAKMSSAPSQKPGMVTPVMVTMRISTSDLLPRK